MSDARQRFLQCLPQQARILDFGCGSGRDTKFFLDSGFAADAVDGSPELPIISTRFFVIAIPSPVP